ncbi:MAG: low molecular weight phosphatase family protein [Clostridia bacterium]|nr:low molecular weight phosphatase family protein [Clostridia bacterium]
MILLFVCTGNTCRSPMAEGIANALAARRGLPLFARSAGISALEGCAATEEAEIAAAEYGADLSGHRSCRVTAEMCAAADRIAVMTESHREVLLRAFDIPAEKICVLNLPDPYGRGQDAYYAAAARIAEAVEELLEGM